MSTAIERGDAGKRVESPCVRNCCLGLDDVCVGCYRTLTEICGWSAASDEERLAILERCREREQVRKWRPPQP